MNRLSLALAAAALLTLSAHASACDAESEVVVDLRNEPALRIFEDLTKPEGLTLVNIELLDGRTLTANFKACSVRETLDKLSASIGLSITIEGSEITFVSAGS